MTGIGKAREGVRKATRVGGNGLTGQPIGLARISHRSIIEMAGVVFRTEFC